MGMSSCFRLAALGACCALFVRGDIFSLDSFKNISYQQTGNGNTLTLNGGFYSADLNTSVANSYTTVSMAFPGPSSPLNVPQNSTTDYHYQTGLFATQAAMDAAFPFGTYTFTGTSGPTVDTASYSYTADDYSSSLPFLTGTDYASLQGMNTAQAFTLHLSPFTNGSNATFSFIFVTIFDETTSTSVFDAGFLPASTTTVLIPANTLAAGDQFVYEIDFSNRDIIASPGATNPAQLGFDVRADGVFTASAAVPEPSTALLLGLGVVAVAALRRFR